MADLLHKFVSYFIYPFIKGTISKIPQLQNLRLQFTRKSPHAIVQSNPKRAICA